MVENKRVVPTVIVGILTFRPDPFWIVMDNNRKAVMASDGDLLIFSNLVRAHTFMLSIMEADNYVLEQLDWGNLVDVFSRQFSHVLVDYRKSRETRMPLEREISYFYI